MLCESDGFQIPNAGITTQSTFPTCTCEVCADAVDAWLAPAVCEARSLCGPVPPWNCETTWNTLPTATPEAAEEAVFACPIMPIMAVDGSNDEIWFRLNAPACTVCADADAVCELAIDCTELAGFNRAASAPTETIWEALNAALAVESAFAPFNWDSPLSRPELTTLRLEAPVWDACENACASCEAEICCEMPGERGEAMSEAAGAATSRARAEAMSGAPIASEIVWVASALAAAVASADTTFDCVTCGVATAAPSVDPPETSAPVPEGVDEAVTGAPVHVQFHTQLHPHAWLIAKLAAAPFGPVQVQFQIHWPATAAGAEEGRAGEAEEAAEEDVELDVPEAGVEEVWESIHDQIQLEPAVDASATPVGRTFSVHAQFQIHASAPVGTTTVLPGRTTLTLMLFWPVVVALAETAFAVDVLVCEEIVSAPGLPTRTEMLTFVGFV